MSRSFISLTTVGQDTTATAKRNADQPSCHTSLLNSAHLPRRSGVGSRSPITRRCSATGHASSNLEWQGTAGYGCTEISVANEFSVARTTAKAAVERLVHDGLLRRAANKSARVPVLGFDEVRDVYFSRGLLEATVMQRLAIDGMVPQDAKSALRRFDAAVELDDQAEVVEADIAFHRSLVDSLGSERFSRVYQSLMGEAQLCMAQVQYLSLLNPRHHCGRTRVHRCRDRGARPGPGGGDDRRPPVQCQYADRCRSSGTGRHRPRLKPARAVRGRR